MHTDVGIPGLDSAGARHPVSLAGAREVPAGRRKQRSSEKRPPPTVSCLAALESKPPQTTSAASNMLERLQAVDNSRANPFWGQRSEIRPVYVVESKSAVSQYGDSV